MGRLDDVLVRARPPRSSSSSRSSVKGNPYSSTSEDGDVEGDEDGDVDVEEEDRLSASLG